MLTVKYPHSSYNLLLVNLSTLHLLCSSFTLTVDCTAYHANGILTIKRKVARLCLVFFCKSALMPAYLCTCLDVHQPTALPRFACLSLCMPASMYGCYPTCIHAKHPALWSVILPLCQSIISHASLLLSAYASNYISHPAPLPSSYYASLSLCLLFYSVCTFFCLLSVCMTVWLDL